MRTTRGLARIGTVERPAPTNTAVMTYMHDGVQYIVAPPVFVRHRQRESPRDYCSSLTEIVNSRVSPAPRVKLVAVRLIWSRNSGLVSEPRAIAGQGESTGINDASRHTCRVAERQRDVDADTFLGRPQRDSLSRAEVG